MHKLTRLLVPLSFAALCLTAGCQNEPKPEQKPLPEESFYAQITAVTDEKDHLHDTFDRIEFLTGDAAMSNWAISLLN